MEKMMIIFNKEGNTLDIWFDSPKKEFISEETGEETILKKDRRGRIIGIERLNFMSGRGDFKKKSIGLPVEFFVK